MKNSFYKMRKITATTYEDYIETLDTSDINHNYFYTERSSSNSIYIYFRDWSYDFYSENLELCFTDKNPETTDVLSNCTFNKIHYRSSTKTSYLKEYYYEKFFSDYYYDNNDKYIIVHYSGKNLNGLLKVKVSYNQIFDTDIKDEDDMNEQEGPEKEPEQVQASDKVDEEINEESNTFMAAWLIAVIIIGAIIVLSIIITIIVVICICSKRNTYYGQVGFYNSPNIPNVTTNSPVSDPLFPQTPYPIN